MHKRCCILAAFCAAALYAEAPSVYAIRNATVVTVSGPVLSRATVVVRDGLIDAAGPEAAVPPGAWVIDGEGLMVYPGLIDALSSWGISEPTAQPAPPAATPPSGTPTPPARPMGPEDRPSNTSWLRAADLVNPADRRLEAARNAGFTTAVAFPTRGIFAGQGAVLNLAGQRAGGMVVASPVGQYLTLSFGGAPGFPASLMGAIAYIRQVFLDAEHYRTAKAEYARGASGLKRPAYDRALEGLTDAGRILLPASSAVQINRMLELAAELKVNTVLYGGHEAYRAAGALKQSGAAVLVSLKWPARDKDADPDEQEPSRVLEMWERSVSTPAVLEKAGVPFAFYSDGVENPKDLLPAVRRAIAAGLSREAALRAVPLAPARIYGVAARLGAIEPGKIANLVVTKGELFQESTEVKYVFVDGVKFEPAAEPKEEKKP
jgi:imidazolonepropionase-like amidohydrolase